MSLAAASAFWNLRYTGIPVSCAPEMIRDTHLNLSQNLAQRFECAFQWWPDDWNGLGNRERDVEYFNRVLKASATERCFRPIR